MQGLAFACPTTKHVPLTPSTSPMTHHPTGVKTWTAWSTTSDPMSAERVSGEGSRDQPKSAQHDFAFVRDMLSAWVDRGFTLAVGYIGSLIAVGAAVATDRLGPLIDGTGVSRPVAIAGALGILNGLYLTLAGTSVIAILKRAYFIMAVAPQESPIHLWERYSRSRGFVPLPSAQPTGNVALKGLRWFFWTADNMYVVPLYVLVWSFSAVIGLEVWPLPAGGNDWIPIAAAAFLHVLAAVLGWGVVDWNRLCYAAARSTHEASSIPVREPE